MSLADITDLASYMRRPPFTGDDADTAQLMLDGAIAAVVEYCGWHIAPELTETITIDGSGTIFQSLPSLYVTDISAVSELGSPQSMAFIDWSTYGLMEKRNGGLWTARRRGVEVTLTHGFMATPGWLKTMICAVAGRAFLVSLGVVQEAAGGESATYHGSAGAVVVLPEEKISLNRLALPKVG